MELGRLWSQEDGLKRGVVLGEGLIYLESGLVSWCFKPSQPQRITSGLLELGRLISGRWSQKKGVFCGGAHLHGIRETVVSGRWSQKRCGP